MNNLRDFFFESTPNSPQNPRINIDTSRSSDSVIISYTDGGSDVRAYLGITHPKGTMEDRSLNGWFNVNGQMVWKGFFQDIKGAIVVVIDSALGNGDGGPPQYVGGSVWYQNFEQGYPYNSTYMLGQGPNKMCWQIQMGNYDCRTFIIGDYVSQTSALYPNNRGPDKSLPYQKLGTFTNLKRADANL